MITTTTREDLHTLLREHGYDQGKPNTDPDIDATHVWYGPLNQSFVLFRPDGENVVFGDADSEDAGSMMTYEEARQRIKPDPEGERWAGILERTVRRLAGGHTRGGIFPGSEDLPELPERSAGGARRLLPSAVRQAAAQSPPIVVLGWFPPDTTWGEAGGEDYSYSINIDGSPDDERIIHAICMERLIDVGETTVASVLRKVRSGGGRIFAAIPVEEASDFAFLDEMAGGATWRFLGFSDGKRVVFSCVAGPPNADEVATVMATRTE